MTLYPLLRPVIFALDGERAHRLTIAGLKAMPRRTPPPSPPMLRSEISGLSFPNPVGLAAGFDKDAEVPDAMLGVGFGFVEIGTVTPLAQPGNPKPRLFRLAADEAVINRLGFNNAGQTRALERLQERDRSLGLIGVNIGANKLAVEQGKAIEDYRAGAETMAPVADFLTVNISSPNTPGLRALQDGAMLAELLAAVTEARGDHGPPIFLKLAPDLEPGEVDAMARAAIDGGAAAIVIGNTTLSRPALRSRYAGETGGLSGKPLAPLALERLRDFRNASGGALPLIAVGGIDSAEAAWTRIRAGASLVQLYSALVYHGPALAMRIVAGLERLRQHEGFATIADAVGSEPSN